LRMYRDISYASTPEDAVADALHAGDHQLNLL
jgi:hypothetical protein